MKPPWKRLKTTKKRRETSDPPKGTTKSGKPKKWKSSLEPKVASQLESFGVSFVYEDEDHLVPYTLECTYYPDFRLSNGVILEAKGFLRPEDRRKHLAIKVQHPSLDIRFVFQNAYTKLNPKSKTTYAMWCERHGFLWAHKVIPVAWLLGCPKEEAEEAQVILEIEPMVRPRFILKPRIERTPQQ